MATFAWCPRLGALVCRCRTSCEAPLSGAFGRRVRRAKGFVARDARRREMVTASGRQIAAHRGPQQKPESAASHERRRRDADLWVAPEQQRRAAPERSEGGVIAPPVGL